MESVMEHRPPTCSAQSAETVGSFKIDPERWYSVSEIAQAFNKSAETVRRFRKKHNIASKFGRTPLTRGVDIIRALTNE